MRWTFFFVLLVLVVLLLGGQSDNALSAPRNILVNESTGGQHLPSITLGPSNQIYIVWVDCRNDPTYYSVDEGVTWKEIVVDWSGSPHGWTISALNGNKKQSFIKVVGFDAEGKQVGADKSDKPFTIQIVEVTYPSDPGISFTSGIEETIQWEVYPTKSSVETVEIYLTKDGGSTWTLLYKLPGDYRSIAWTPEVGMERKQCKVKVVLKDIKGNRIGIDSSDNYFTVKPP